MAWRSLGAVIPVLETRMFFTPTQASGEIFRIDFANVPQKNYSFGWLAWQYQGQDLEVLPYTQAIKIWPLFHSQLLFLPYPLQLLNLGYDRRQFCVTKSRKDLVHLWSMSISELI